MIFVCEHGIDNREELINLEAIEFVRIVGVCNDDNEFNKELMKHEAEAKPYSIHFDWKAQIYFKSGLVEEVSFTAYGYKLFVDALKKIGE